MIIERTRNINSVVGYINCFVRKVRYKISYNQMVIFEQLS